MNDITNITTSYAILSHTWQEDDEEVNSGRPADEKWTRKA